LKLQISVGTTPTRSGSPDGKTQTCGIESTIG